MTINRFPVRNQWLVLVLFWIAFQLIFFFRFGIVTGFESEKYIFQAESLLTKGHYTSGNFLFYSTQILLIAFTKITHTFPWLVITVQLLFNFYSVYSFYKLILLFTRKEFTSFCFTLAFQCMFYYHLYNVHLFTESLFFSFSIIYTYILFTVRRISFKTIPLLIAGLSFVYFTRPTGVFFIPSTIVYLAFKFYRKKAWMILGSFFVLALLLLYFLLNFALDSGGEFDFLLPYLDEIIICGVPTIPYQHKIYIPVEKNSVEGLFYIITHYPSLFFKLALSRLQAFFGVVRPYYGTGHNIFIAFYFYGSYLLGIIGLRKLSIAFLPHTCFFLCNIFFVMITVMLSCDEWHNRFILALLPFFLLLASGAFIPKTDEDVQ